MEQLSCSVRPTGVPQPVPAHRGACLSGGQCGATGGPSHGHD
ncbi:hypothetical protein PJI17_26140 [Mycobacterium kansasii]|uniref:Uncharacterized protein n=1 Tax=Mycobacterium kansasii TaxID=1768 RepID=A0A1V3XWR3_MYCKA|nr:hypothetical protein BZL30_0505 [Mycobacterium kansasii]OOK83683.1 hypothetical protein BZL29_1336 [Mycobacterium kansasii]